MINRETILSQIKQTVNEVDPSADVILFGSRARGDNRPDSDWDILVVTSKQIDKAFEKVLLRRLVTLQIELGIDINYVIRTNTAWAAPTAIPLYKSIKREGIRL